MGRRRAPEVFRARAGGPGLPGRADRAGRWSAAERNGGLASEVHTLERAVFEVKRIIVGQDQLVERMLVGLLAKGHVLLEGVPGVAKTLAVETFAKVVGGTFARIQFTPDLVPTDIVGTRIYRRARRSSTSSSARWWSTSCSPTRSTARPPRCSPRCSR